MTQETDPSTTFRQRLVELLSRRDWTFGELQRELEIPVRTLEEHLRHVDKSLRGTGQKLRVEPARCLGCGFVFRERSAHHFHPPGRCPVCRGDRIKEPLFKTA